MVSLTILSSLVARAQQSGSLKGQVLDQTGATITGITVLIEGTQLGAITDLNGRFNITDLANGTYTLRISGIGYKTQSRKVSVAAGQQVELELTLVENSIEMEEIRIIGASEGRQLKLSAKSVQVIETREVKLKAADLGEVMAQTEGVNVQRAGGLGSNTRFSLNGLSGDQVRFFYNGVPLNYSLYSFGIANVPVNLIDRVEIYKGVVPIQFGADALGGAVNLVSSSTFDGLGGSASYQVGSFGTHRVTGNINYADPKTGLFVVAGGFYDYTDNNYKIDTRKDILREDGSITGRSTALEVRRFHDAYRAYGANIKIGVRNKPWAKELSLEGYHGDYYNEVQNSQSPGLVDLPQLGFENVVFGSPFGDAVFTSFSQGINLNYKVDLYEKLILDLVGGYNYNERVSIDTSSYRYNWLGERLVKESGSQEFIPGEFGEANHFVTKNESAFARQQLTYTLSNQHILKFSIAPTYVYRTGDDLLRDGADDPALADNYLFDLVSGLEYTLNLADNKFQNITFIKNYRQSISIESRDPSLDEILTDERSVSNYGAGTGMRYDWSPRFSTKLSYEYAYRLPRQDEIFGNGLLVQGNLELRPESSHNVNLQWSYGSKEQKASTWQLQGNFFLRKIDDLIFLLLDANDFGAYQNIWSATSQGIELSGRWKDLIKGFTLSANATYQDYLNTSETGPFVRFEGDRIPNTPYFFANGSAQYELQDVIGKSDKLSFFWSTRFVHSYFVGWESSGNRQTKLEVPGQVTHAAGLTHRMNIKKIQNALTLEVQNLTNTKVFDSFGLQRPGRAFYIKSTFQF